MAEPHGLIATPRIPGGTIESVRLKPYDPAADPEHAKALEEMARILSEVRPHWLVRLIRRITRRG